METVATEQRPEQWEVFPIRGGQVMEVQSEYTAYQAMLRDLLDNRAG